MKTKQLIVSTLAAAFAGQVVLIAQNPPPPPSEPPPVPDAGQIAAQAVTAAHDIVRTQLDQVNVEVQKQLAQAQQAVQLAQSGGFTGGGGGYGGGVSFGEAPEPPEPPEPPENVFGAGGGMGGGMGGVGVGMGGEMGGMVGAMTGFGAKATASPLVIFADQPADTRLADTQEDLNIMSRILTKAISRAGEDREDPFALGIRISSFTTSHQPRALYLEGYGAVFTAMVSFPLTPPASRPVKQAEKAANSTWEQTKQELYGGAPKNRSTGMNEEMMRRYGLVLPAVPKRERPYDPDRVERLKQALLDALKNASNFRHLKPEEQIVVAVSSGDGSAKEVRTVNVVQKGRSGGGATVTTTESGDATTPGNTLVIRIKKSDTDDFAAGKLDQAGFAERAKIAIY